MSYSRVGSHELPSSSPDSNAIELTHYSLSISSKDHNPAELEGPRPQAVNSTYVSILDSKLEGARLDRPKEFKAKNSRGRVRGIMRVVWLTVFLPAIAFVYLTFCYVAATRLVPVRIWMINQPMEHFYGIKAGVTTINIVIIAIALLPLKTLLGDIKSEEFFRILHKSTSGAPMKDVNNVSLPSYTLSRGVQAIIGKSVSKYYAGAIFSGIIAAAISSLAPAALSVGLIETESEIMAIQVGAIPLGSIINGGMFDPTLLEKPSLSFEARTGEAASRGWVQNVLGAEISFTPASVKYAVPVPLNLRPTTRARYLTDVVILDPACSWTVPEGPLVPFTGATARDRLMWLNLTSSGVGIAESMVWFESYWIERKHLEVAGTGTGAGFLKYGLRNLSTSGPVTDGTMAWFISQCTSCTPPTDQHQEAVLDLSSIPTRDLVFNKTDTSTNITTLYTVKFSALVCKPQASVETREIVLHGNSKLQVLEQGGLVRQGNLHFGQTLLMLAYGLIRYTTDSGPKTNFTSMGRAAQVRMFFGSNLGNSTKTPVLKPQSVEQITEQYGLAQQAALRSYLSGKIASAYVPGRVQTTKLVFTGSLPHIIASTILFVSIALFVNLCYLRPEMEQFTLFSVVVVLARSNVGAECEEAEYVTRAGNTGMLEETGIKLVENRWLRLTENGGPGTSLHLQ